MERTTRRLSSRLSSRPDNSKEPENSDEPVVVSGLKRKTPLVSKQNRKVLSGGESSTDELFNLVETKKRKSGAAVRKPKKQVIRKDSSSSESSEDVESNQARVQSEEESSDDEILLKHKQIKKRKSVTATKPQKEEGTSSWQSSEAIKEDSNEDSFDSSAKENYDCKVPQRKKATVSKNEVLEKEVREEKSAPAPVSEFEAIRLKNIEERQKMFQQLNLGQLRVEMEEQRREKSASAPRKSSLYFAGSSKSTTPTEPVRKSARLQGMEAKKLELPPERVISEFVRRNKAAPSTSSGKSSLFHYHSDWDSKARNSQAVLSLDEALHNSFEGKENSKLLLDCCMRMCLSKDEDQGVLESDRCTMKEFKDTMENLSLKEQHKIKVIYQEIHFFCNVAANN